MRSGVAISATLVLICAAASAFAQESIILQFNNRNGYEPIAGLTSDSAGNLYGTTFYGGNYGVGTAFKLTPRNGGWQQTILYNFNELGVEAFWPNSRMAMDAAGNLYGTTFFGGGYEVGTVFELSPTSEGSWTEKTLHSFSPGGPDGTYPHGGVILDAAGNIYGTTGGGGNYGNGIVYELSPNGSGGWSEKVLHSFQGVDGSAPFSSLLMDSAGNLYGTTANGGNSSLCQDGCGTVYELSPNPGGTWTEKVLWNFHLADGANPYGAVVSDAAGNLYGTAGAGAVGGFGAVFELTPAAGGNWSEQLLHTFNPHDGDGAGSSGTLVFDSAGDLYGTALSGGAYGRGAVFELTPGAGGWTESVVYSFSSINGNGYDPVGQLALGADGNLYGATVSGGERSCFDGCGIIFQITP